MDDVLVNKADNIERCIKRINETYIGFEEHFLANYNKQDIVVLNLQRACEAAIDMGARVIKLKKLPLPQEGKEVFHILRKNKIISFELAENLSNMVGFRNIAVHDYQNINMDIVEDIIKNRLPDFEELIKALLKIE